MAPADRFHDGGSGLNVANLTGEGPDQVEAVDTHVERDPAALHAAMTPRRFRHDHVRGPASADASHQQDLQLADASRFEKPLEMASPGHVTAALKHAQHAFSCVGQLAHPPGGADRNGHGLFGKQVLAAAQGRLGHLVVQGVAREVVDGRNRRLGHHAAKIAVDLDFHVVLEIGDILVRHGQGITGKLAHG